MLVREQPDVNSLVYEERLIAFVDILGWRDAVSGPVARASTDLGWMIGLLQTIESQAAAHESFAAGLPQGIVLPGLATGVQVSQFSDSIVVSIPAEAVQAQAHLEDTLYHMTSLAAQNGFMLRGGISKGKLFHQNGMVFGPALIDAYDLESRLAVFPRVVLSRALEEAFYPGSRLEDEGGVYGHRRAWRRDSDGVVFHDYMQPYWASEIYTESGREAWMANMHSLNQFKGVICRGMCGAANERVLQKYEWARDYFMEVVEEYPSLDVYPVVVDIDGKSFAFDKLKWPMVTFATS